MIDRVVLSLTIKELFWDRLHNSWHLLIFWSFSSFGVLALNHGGLDPIFTIDNLSLSPFNPSGVSVVFGVHQAVLSVCQIFKVSILAKKIFCSYLKLLLLSFSVSNALSENLALECKEQLNAIGIYKLFVLRAL